MAVGPLLRGIREEYIDSIYKLNLTSTAITVVELNCLLWIFILLENLLGITAQSFDFVRYSRPGQEEGQWVNE